MSLQGKTVLVTGGAGFIGSHLTDALLAAGCHVRVLDNFSTGHRENLSSALEDPAFTLIEGDIRDMAVCRHAVQGCDYVFHEAALGSVPRSLASPEETVSVNVAGFVNVITAAKDAGVQRLVYASSSSVYGDEPQLPKEEDRIGTQLSPYAVSKYCNELFAANFSACYGMELIGLRYFNVFGPRQDPEGPYAAVIPKFIKCLKKHLSPVINGDGTNSRDFTYIRNVVQVNLLALTAGNEAVNTVYNVACGERTDLNELFAMVREELAAFDPAIDAVSAEHGPNRAGDIPHSLASIEKAVRLLGYKPECSVKEGLRSAAEWYYRNLD